MEIIGLLASIEGLADGAFNLVSFINTIKEGGKQRLRLFTELNALWMVLKVLETNFESESDELGETWLKTVAVLDEDNGVFDQISRAFENLDSRLRPRTGHRKVLQTLRWPFDKPEVDSLVSHLERLKSSIELAMTSTSAAVIRQIASDTKALKVSAADDELKAILDWISSLNFLKQQNDFIRQTREGTCQWFLENDDFQTWLSSKEAVLFSPGIPGAGKTFLASICFEHLKKVNDGKNVAVLIIYCGYNETKSQSIDNLVAALIKQVLQQRPDVSKELKESWQQHSRTQVFPSLEKLTKMFRAEISKFDDCYIIIDGLDEILDETKRLLLLETLIHGQIKVMILSRPLESILELFIPIADISCDGCEEENLRLIYHCKQCLGRGFDLCDACHGQEMTCPEEGHYIVKRFGSYQVDVGATESDVRSYVEARVNQEPRLLENVTKKRALRDEIASTIVQQSNGMFLLAKLHVDALATKRTPKAVQEALQMLPTQIGATYDQAMERIEATNEDDRKIAMNFLLWITFAARPLSVSEIQHACSVDSEIREIDPDEVLPASDLASMCAGLVIVDASDIVRLVHFSAQNYFYENRDRWFPEGETVLAQDCLSYLSLKAFDKGACFGPTERDEFATRSLEYPLLDYCCSYWGDHAVHATQSGPLTDRILRFLNNPQHLDSAVQALWYSENRAAAGWDVKRGVSALHLAAYFGLTNVVTRLLREGAAVDSPDTLSTTPLMYAAAGGQASTVQELLRAGANPNLLCGRGSSCIHRAISFDKTKAAWPLLDHPDIDVNIMDSSHGSQTPLMLAASLSRHQIVSFLIDKPGLDINFQSGESQSTALHCAAQSGNSKVTRTILSHPDIDVNRRNRWCTPLTDAATNGYSAVVEALLDHGADTELQEGVDKASGTPLNRAIDYGYRSTVRILLERGANPQVFDIYNRTIIHSAAVNGQDEILQLLFEERVDVDINAQGTNGRTALHDAAYFDYCSTIEILFAHGARTDIRDGAYRTPLGVARDMDNTEAVKLLSRLRREEMARDESVGPLKHNTTSIDSNEMELLKATKLGMTEAVQSYISRASTDPSIDINVADLDKHTAVHLAISNRRFGILKVLVKAGADLNAVDHLQRTPLHWTILHSNYRAAEYLLQSGVQVDLEDHFEETALDMAFNRTSDLASLLMTYGAWPKAKRLQAALYAAAMYGTAGLVRKLVEAGANPLKKDSFGQTPYHVAEEGENKETAEMILALCEGRREPAQSPPAEVKLSSRAKANN